MADHATTVVGRGISLWIAVQSLSQLDAVYGKVRASVMRDNMESQIYYRPSNQQTADYLEHCLGKISQYAHSQTSREGAIKQTGGRFPDFVQRRNIPPPQLPLLPPLEDDLWQGTGQPVFRYIDPDMV